VHGAPALTSPARILHRIAGSPQEAICAPVPGDRVCRICGLPVGRGTAWEKWIPTTATDWSTWQGPPGAGASPVVCEACVWARSGKPETVKLYVPNAIPEQLPSVLRMYCHLWDEVHGWRWGTKAGKRFLRNELLRTLATPAGTRWFAAFTDGGLTAKQSIAYARVCVAGSGHACVVFDVERLSLTIPPGRTGWPLLATVQEAYDAGWSKEEIERGQAYRERIKALGVALCDGFASRLRRHVGSPELQLAVWLAQRDAEQTEQRDEQEEETSASSAVGRDDTGEHPQQLGGPADRPGAELPGTAHEDVEPHPGHDVQRGPADEPAGPLVHDDPPQPADREPGERIVAQLSLFDLGDEAGVVPGPRRRRR
jgi:hypothetical protein